MPKQIHISPDGVKYRFIANKKTTPTTDGAAKKIVVDTVAIEVIVSDSRLRSIGSQWGHVAIEIDGIVYSRAHEEYVKIDKHTYFHGGIVNLTNGSIKTSGNLWRDNIGLVLRISPAEKGKIKDKLERRVSADRAFRRLHPNGSTYSIFDNSCSSNVADVLESIGILAHDPRWLPTPVTPAGTGCSYKEIQAPCEKKLLPEASRTMKNRYLALGFIQLCLIFVSGWFRRASWRDIDFISDARSSSMQISFYCLAGWLVTLAIAARFAVADKINRSMIALFLIVTLPSVEFLLWFSLSF